VEQLLLKCEEITLKPFFVVGTRPEIVKMTPIVREFERRNIDLQRIALERMAENEDRENSNCLFWN
jgi:hypothetical protein